eukprot:4964049-Pyramimonas_sp.AAC.1
MGTFSRRTYQTQAFGSHLRGVVRGQRARQFQALRLEEVEPLLGHRHRLRAAHEGGQPDAARRAAPLPPAGPSEPLHPRQKVQVAVLRRPGQNVPAWRSQGGYRAVTGWLHYRPPATVASRPPTPGSTGGSARA